MRSGATVGESLEEADTRPQLVVRNDIMPAGKVVLRKHTRERELERQYTDDYIFYLLKRAAKEYPEQLKDEHDTAFIVKDGVTGESIAVKKIEYPDHNYVYSVVTVHPTLKIGKNQTVYKV